MVYHAAMRARYDSIGVRVAAWQDASASPSSSPLFKASHWNVRSSAGERANLEFTLERHERAEVDLAKVMPASAHSFTYGRTVAAVLPSEMPQLVAFSGKVQRSRLCVIGQYIVSVTMRQTRFGAVCGGKYKVSIPLSWTGQDHFLMSVGYEERCRCLAA
jgi:hypothetical protein